MTYDQVFPPSVPVLSGGATLAPVLHLLLFLLLPHLLLHLPHLLLHLRHLLHHLVHLPLRLIQGRFVLPFYSHISHFLSNFSHLQHSRIWKDERRRKRHFCRNSKTLVHFGMKDVMKGSPVNVSQNRLFEIFLSFYLICQEVLSYVTSDIKLFFI